MTDKAITVVVADDEIVMRNLVLSVLRDAGFDVVGVAADGAEAVSLCGQLKPDVLLLDVYMPGISGVKTLKILNKSEYQPNVVMLTSEKQSQILDDCFQLGAKHCVQKEGGLDRLPSIIHRSLGH